MKTNFRFVALPFEQFEPLFASSDAELRAAGVRRFVVSEKPGSPCRVSLVDAEVGETVLLLAFTHHDVSSPYRGSGPIIVRSGAKTASPAVDEIPAMFRHRLLSVRGYDETSMLVGSKVVNGSDLEDTIRNFFSDPNILYLHVHNAGPGCFNCSVIRT